MRIQTFVKLILTVAVAFAVLGLGSAYAGTFTYSNYTASSDLTNALQIDGANAIADSFTVGGNNSTITSVTFDAWLLGADTLGSVDWLITSDPFAGTTYGSGTATSFTTGGTFNSPGSLGLSAYGETFAINLAGLAAGTYWLELTNAVAPPVTGGDSVYWDVSNGLSTAYTDATTACNVDNNYCSGSESFSVTYDYSSGGGQTPEPATAALLGAGLILAGVLRRKLVR